MNLLNQELERVGIDGASRVNAVRVETDVDSMCQDTVQEFARVASEFGFHAVLQLTSNPIGLKTHFSQFEKLPANVEQWAVDLSQKAWVASKTVFETISDTTPITLVAVPTGSDVFLGFFMGEEEVTSEKIDWFEERVRNLELPPAIEAEEAVEQENQESLASRKDGVAEDLAALCELNQRLIISVDEPSFAKSLCEGLVSALKNMDSSAAVDIYVGLVPTKGPVKWTAVSGKEFVSEESSLMETVESAMMESICRNESSSWPPKETERHALVCHRRLVDLLNCQRVQSHLVRSSDDTLQIVFLVTGDRLSQRQMRFCEVVSDQVGDRFQLVKRTEKGYLERALSSIQDSYRSAKVRFVARLLMGLILLSLIPTPYSVSHHCEVRPAHRRFVSAPFNAPLQSCEFEPGDEVSVGEALARLDDREIRLELARNTAEMQRAEKASDGHLVNRESGKARLAELEYEKLAARNRLLQYQIDHLVLKSPIDGIVVAGDLQDSIGMPLEKGTVVFEIAPLDEFAVDVYIKEEDVHVVKSGANVEMWFEAVPFQSIQGVVENVHPESKLRENENVFLARVRLNESVRQMRPGMRGSFRIRTVWRPTLWNWIHKPVIRSLRWFRW